MRHVLAQSTLAAAVLGGIAGCFGAGQGVRAQEFAYAPLELTVHPNGVEAGPSGPGGETLDQKLARRDRTVRFICIGCVRADGRVDDTPFWPIRTLNSPQLTAALAEEP